MTLKYVHYIIAVSSRAAPDGAERQDMDTLKGLFGYVSPIEYLPTYLSQIHPMGGERCYFAYKPEDRPITDEAVSDTMTIFRTQNRTIKVYRLAEL